MTRKSFRTTVTGALVLAGFVTTSSVPAQAQSQNAERPAQVLKLTLDDAVRRAVDNNPDLAIVRLGTEVEAARVGESRSAYTPVFSTA